MEKIDNGMEGCRSTIIIPNYNGMAYLENCLASLRGEPARVIVVDNGSTDGRACTGKVSQSPVDFP